MRRPAADLAAGRGDPLLWLASLTLPSGAIRRLSTQPVSFVSRAPNGGTFGFQAGLSGLDDFTESIDMLGTSGSTGTLTQATIRISVTDDLAALQASYHEIGACTVEIALAFHGDAWEDREILLSGAVIQGVEFGYVGEETALSIELGPDPTSALVGDDARDVGTDWPDTLLDVAGAGMSSVVGQKYQWVLGAPSSVPGIKVGNSGGTNRLILAGHAFGTLTAVTVYEDGVSQGTFTPATTTANSGYTYVSSATEFSASSGAYTYAATYGGVASVDRPGGGLTAARVLVWLLTNSGLPVDWAETQGAIDGLASWPAGIYLDQEASMIDVIRDQLVPWLPIVEVKTGVGVAFLYVDPYAAATQCQGTLTMGQEILGRTGLLRMTDLDKIRNVFTMNYKYNAYTGEYDASVTLSVTSSQVCAVSQEWYGERPEEAFDCDLIHDKPTALRSLAQMAARLALPRRVARYLLSPSLYWLRPGSIWRITDPGYGISSAVAYLVEIKRGRAIEATFELLDLAVTGRA